MRLAVAKCHLPRSLFSLFDRDGVAAQARKKSGHRKRIACRTKNGVDARYPNRRKELAQIEADNKRLAGVRFSVRSHRPAPTVGLGRLVGRDLVEKFMKQLALDPFKAWLGHLK
jgi:hypothetical protein